MSCNNCNLLCTKLYILLPCCDTICVNCVNNSKEKCIKCNTFITSQILKKVSTEIENDHERIFNNKYKQIYFLGSGSFGCVHLVQNIENKKM